MSVVAEAPATVIAASPAMREILTIAGRLAQAKSPVLLEG